VRLLGPPEQQSPSADAAWYAACTYTAGTRFRGFRPDGRCSARVVGAVAEPDGFGTACALIHGGTPSP
jgi:hypothetical protein